MKIKPIETKIKQNQNEIDTDAAAPGAAASAAAPGFTTVFTVVSRDAAAEGGRAGAAACAADGAGPGADFGRRHQAMADDRFRRREIRRQLPWTHHHLSPGLCSNGCDLSIVC